jgi:hypothetical protein
MVDKSNKRIPTDNESRGQLCACLVNANRTLTHMADSSSQKS